MVLSSRIVYFINGQLFWQCQSVFESEDRTMQVNDRRVEWSLNTSSYPNYLVSRTRSFDGPLANSDAIKKRFHTMDLGLGAFLSQTDQPQRRPPIARRRSGFLPPTER